MKSRVAMVWLAALVGCHKVSVEPHGIAPDGVSSSHSSIAASTVGSGAGGAAAAGGSGGGAVGDGAGPHGESGARLRVTSYAGSDGSRILRADAYDSELGFYCFMFKDDNGATRCYPPVLSGAHFFADDACAVPAVGFAACGFGDVSHVTVQMIDNDPSVCPRLTYKAYKLVSARSDFAYGMSAGECVRVSNPGTVYAAAVEVPDDALAAVTEEVDSP